MKNKKAGIFSESLKKGFLLNDYIETWDIDSYNRFILFKNDFPEIFNIHMIDSSNNIIIEDYEINFPYIIEKINEYYTLNDRYGYLKFIRNVHKFLLEPYCILREPEFLWDMLIKYNGIIKDATIYDYRKWKIKKILNPNE